VFTPEERDATAAAVADALSGDSRVASVISFGSRETGEADKHSDVDLAALVHDELDPEPIAAEWVTRLEELLPVLHRFNEQVGPARLCGFLLENFLEVDVAFAHAAVFDEPDEPLALGPSELAEIYRAKADFIWHDVLHTVAAIDRGRPLRALFYIERLRHGTIELASARLALDTRHHKQADELPEATRAALDPTLVRSFDRAELLRAARAATVAFFAEARELQPELADKLERPLLAYIDDFSA
jgi:predicted nucleotidyltransferase